MNCDLVFPTTIFVDDFQLDNSEIIRYAKNRRAYDQGVQKSNLGGYQSDENFFNAKVCSPLVKKLEEIFAQIGDTLKISVPLFIDSAWVNINCKGDSNARHVHPRSLFSGVYYLQVEENCGNIMFHSPLVAKEMMDPPFSELISNVTANTLIYQAQVGRCIIFPSWLEHSVEPNRSDGERISISFNAFYKMS